MVLTMRPASFAAALAALLTVAACGPRGEPGTIHLNGRLEAPQVDLAPKVAGRVVEVLVREGDRVRAGQILVKLDLLDTALAVPRDRKSLKAAEARYEDLSVGSRPAEIAAAQADVADKEAAVELARRELERQRTLLDRQVTSAQDFDRARTELDRATAALKASEEKLALQQEGFRKWQTEQAREDVGRAQAVLGQSEALAREAEIRAPADAVVLHRIAEPGLLVSPGQPALTLAFTDRLYVRTFVPETRLGRVRPGLAATVSVDAFPGRSFPARVTEISPDAEFTPKPVETRSERVNLVYAAKVDLDRGWNEPLVPGQPAEVTIRTVEASAR
jgi:HlyD family secretion protein